MASEGTRIPGATGSVSSPYGGMQTFKSGDEASKQAAMDYVAGTTAIVNAKGGRAPVKPKPKQPVQRFNYNQDQLASIYRTNPTRALELGYTPPTVGAEDLNAAPVAVTSQPEDTTLSESLAATAGTTAPVTDGPRALTPRDLVQPRMMELFQEGQQYDAAQIREEAGVYEREAEANRLSQEYDQAVVNQRRTIQEMRQNPEGKLVGALNASIENYQYESDQNLADKAMALHYARQDYQSAYNIAQDAIDAQEKRYDKQMGFYKSMYTMLGDDMTDSEQAAFTSELRLREQAIGNFMDAKQEALRAAGANGAPLEVMQAIKNAPDAESVWTAAGNYGVDPGLALARDKFRWDKWYAQQKMAIDTMARAGEITKENEVALRANNALYAQNNKGLQVVNSLLANDVGFGAATGASQNSLLTTARLVLQGRATETDPLGITVRQQRDEFLADANYVINNLTFEKLAAITENTTLGQISEKELELVGSAATELEGLAIRDEGGNLVGFKGTPEKVESLFVEVQTNMEDALNKLNEDRAYLDAQLGRDSSEVEALYNS